MDGFDQINEDLPRAKALIGLDGVQISREAVDEPLRLKFSRCLGTEDALLVHSGWPKNEVATPVAPRIHPFHLYKFIDLGPGSAYKSMHSAKAS